MKSFCRLAIDRGMTSFEPMPRAEAEALAASALEWLTRDPGRLGAFLAVTGAGLEDLRGLIADPVFLGSVLDFLLSDEAMLMAFCEALDLAPDRPMRARAGLPGGDLPHWT